MEIHTDIHAMKEIKASSLTEFAESFWKRQKDKNDRNDRVAVTDFKKKGDELRWVVNLYPYKLPNPMNDVVRVVEIETKEELDELLIHDGLQKDSWMINRCLVPCPKTRRLGALADYFICKGYFETDWPDTQLKVFKEWKGKDSVKDLINDQQGLPLIEMTWPGQYEIVDGWGRLLAMAALVRSKVSFHPFTCFLATRDNTARSSLVT